MEIEKTFVLPAPPARAWAMLLDPQLMAACVPGMQSVEVVSPTEYTAQIQVKIAFITARFRLRTTIVEQRAPEYLRTEGTGEDKSVASALKQTSELFLTDLGDGRTELRTRVLVDVTGRLGSFGLSVMKTKADRMWEEFCANLVQRVGQVDATVPAQAAAPVAPRPAAAPQPVAASGPAQVPSAAAPSPVAAPVPAAPPPRSPASGAAASLSAPPAMATAERRGWWSRLWNDTPASAQHIRIELRTEGRVLTVEWPAHAGAECAAWLRELTHY